MGNRLTPVVKILLIINLVVFALDQITAESLNTYFGLRHILSDYFAPWQFVTYMFLHGGVMHIFSNMLGLFLFGPWLEQVIGPKKFLIFYMVAGIGAGLLNSGVTYFEVAQQKAAIEEYAQNPSENAFVRYVNTYEPSWNMDKVNDYIEKNGTTGTVEFIKERLNEKINYSGVTVGASGAIFGILIAFAMLFPNVEMMLLFFPVPIKAKYFALLYVLYELYAGVNYSQVSNIAHFAHLGGALIGFLLIKYWKIPRQF